MKIHYSLWRATILWVVAERCGSMDIISIVNSYFWKNCNRCCKVPAGPSWAIRITLRLIYFYSFVSHYRHFFKKCQRNVRWQVKKPFEIPRTSKDRWAGTDDAYRENDTPNPVIAHARISNQTTNDGNCIKCMKRHICFVSIINFTETALISNV
jgi:hypothetical protein